MRVESSKLLRIEKALAETEDRKVVRLLNRAWWKERQSLLNQSPIETAHKKIPMGPIRK